MYLCTNGLTILNSELTFSDPVPVILDVAVWVKIKYYSVPYFDCMPCSKCCNTELPLRMELICTA